MGSDPLTRAISRIANAARRFLEDQSQMATLTGRIFAGHLRSIIGSMTVEDLIRERQKLATEVLDASKTEMAKIGLIVDNSDNFMTSTLEGEMSDIVTSLNNPSVEPRMLQQTVLQIVELYPYIE